MLILVEGKIQHSRVKVRLQPLLAHGPLRFIHAIVVHQTDSNTASSTLNTYSSDPKGNGAHVLIDKDGTIYQTARLDQKCQHVGVLRNRCYEQHNCIGAEKDFYDRIDKDLLHRSNRLKTEGALHEMRKPYPERWPMNSDSIGIEIVGLKLGDRKDINPKSEYNSQSGPWEVPTGQQQGSLQWLVRELLDTYHLKTTDIYRHPQVSRKKDNEAIDAIPYLSSATSR